MLPGLRDPDREVPAPPLPLHVTLLLEFLQVAAVRPVQERPLLFCPLVAVPLGRVQPLVAVGVCAVEELDDLLARHAAGLFAPEELDEEPDVLGPRHHDPERLKDFCPDGLDDREAVLALFTVRRRVAVGADIVEHGLVDHRGERHRDGGLPAAGGHVDVNGVAGLLLGADQVRDDLQDVEYIKHGDRDERHGDTEILQLLRHPADEVVLLSDHPGVEAGVRRDREDVGAVGLVLRERRHRPVDLVAEGDDVDDVAQAPRQWIVLSGHAHHNIH
ncbi:MAG: hypothetical protein BWX50_01611 [Euryarchaeota archaeon ADurb.Bin009]|nr:MAG: hypothetical protein BWX50_01611 [Euryarchaeota archaeon ADurb.Bin009]